MVRTNAAAHRVTGITEAQVRSVQPVQLTVSEDRARAQQQLACALAGEQCTSEARGVSADGAMTEVLVSSAPLSEDDVITGVLTIVHDLTGWRWLEDRVTVFEPATRTDSSRACWAH